MERNPKLPNPLDAPELPAHMARQAEANLHTFSYVETLVASAVATGDLNALPHPEQLKERQTQIFFAAALLDRNKLEKAMEYANPYMIGKWYGANKNNTTVPGRVLGWEIQLQRQFREGLVAARRLDLVQDMDATRRAITLPDVG